MISVELANLIAQRRIRNLLTYLVEDLDNGFTIDDALRRALECVGLGVALCEEDIEAYFASGD